MLRTISLFGLAWALAGCVAGHDHGGGSLDGGVVAGDALSSDRGEPDGARPDARIERAIVGAGSHTGAGQAGSSAGGAADNAYRASLAAAAVTRADWAAPPALPAAEQASAGLAA